MDRGQKGEKKSGRKRLERGPNGGKTAKCRAGVLGGPGAAQGRGRHFRLARLMAERMARRGARLMLWDRPTPQYSLPSRWSRRRM